MESRPIKFSFFFFRLARLVMWVEKVGSKDVLTHFSLVCSFFSFSVKASSSCWPRFVFFYEAYAEKFCVRVEQHAEHTQVSLASDRIKILKK